MKKEQLNIQQNLRASHFTLGNDPQNVYKTVQSQSYTGTIVKKQVENQGEKLALRDTHFILGDYNRNGFYNTTYQIKYPAHKGYEKAGLNDEKLHDLRTHHFKFGQYGPTIKTCNNIVYDTKPIQENLQAERDAQKIKMRSHNHKFAEQENIFMTSNYNEEFNKTTGAQFQGKTQAQIQKQIVDLRRSNIVFGKEIIPMQTTQQGDYIRKEDGRQESKNPNLWNTNFHLGNTKNDFITISKDFHCKQENHEQNKLAVETQQDLRKSHFQMGQDQQEYVTESKGNYRSIQQQNQAIPLKSASINNFTITNPNEKTNYNSAYKTSMKKPTNLEQNEIQRQSKQDRQSNFKLGHQNYAWKTESQAQYSKNDGKPSQLEQGLKDDLRASHFQFNDIKQPAYQTTQKVSYRYANSNLQAKGQIDEKLQKDLRSHHFNLGNQENMYQTTNQRVYTAPQNAERAQFNKQKAQDLRADHFQIN